MSNPKWLPKTPEDRRTRLREEIGEVLQEDGKADRFGLDTRYDRAAHAVTQDTACESNREALLRELRDLKAAIAAVEADLQETPAVVEARGGCHDWTPNAQRCTRHKEADAGL